MSLNVTLSGGPQHGHWIACQSSGRLPVAFIFLGDDGSQESYQLHAVRAGRGADAGEAIYKHQPDAAPEPAGSGAEENP